MDAQTGPHMEALSSASPTRRYRAAVLTLFPTVFLLAAFVCGAFTMSATAAVWLYGTTRGFPEGPGFMLRLTVKGVVFAGVTAWAFWALRRRHEFAPEECPLEPVDGPETWQTRLVFLAGLLATAGLVLPNLMAYPWLAPDESHHLVVARNLAEYGLYASGHPDAGFTVFDAYDSVGPPVIMPAALLFRALGTSLIAARLLVATYFLLLFQAVYFFAKPVFGQGAAILSALMIPMTGSSVYLGRSLYGEVPAFFFVVLALLLWRRALGGAKNDFAGFLAGSCFALAALCKALALISLFALLGVLVYDRMTYRRIRMRHVGWPAAGFVFVFAAWWLYQTLLQPGTSGGPRTTLALYQQLLVVGWDSVGRAATALLGEPGALLGVLGGLAVVIVPVFRNRYDPPAIVLFLVTILYGYWWFFFTPGYNPRYLWFSYAAAGVFTGVLIWTAAHGLLAKASGWTTRVGCAVALCLFALPAIGRTAQQARLVWTFDEMQDDLALAELVRELPGNTRLATTYYPLARTLNFLAHRHVPWVEGLAGARGRYDIVVVDGQTQQDLLVGKTPDGQVGRYALVRTRK